MILNEQKAAQANGDIEAPSAPPPAYPSQPSDSPGPSYFPQSPQGDARPRSDGYPPYSGPWSPPNQVGGHAYDPHSQWLGEQYRNQMMARCAHGDHDVATSFGLCGIICAILLFPVGLICLCIDTEKKCSRCGVRLG